MKTEAARGSLWILLLAAAALCPGQTPPASTKPAPEPKRLLRMENLKPRELPPAAAKRDIFSPGGYAESVVSGPAGRPLAGKAGGAIEAAELAEPPAPVLSVRFVGYSFNEASSRTVGLILVDGVARAVGEGDVLPDGLKIIRVSRDRIEVEKPGGEILTFSLEGDKR